MRSKLKNLLSRKFLAALISIITGIVTITQGQTVVGASLIAVAVISYLIAEGYIDAKSAAATAAAVASVASTVSAATSNTADDAAAAVAASVSDGLAAEAGKST